MPFYKYDFPRITPPWIKYINVRNGSLELPENITQIDERAFCDAYELKGTVSIKPKVTSIGELAFHDCFNMQGIILPETLQSIGTKAFFHCTTLKSVNLPSSLKEIGDSAFKDCFNLRSIEIPENVTKIGAFAFADCYRLSSVTLKAANPEFASKRTFWGCPIKTVFVSPQQKLTKEFKSQFPYGAEFVRIKEEDTQPVAPQKEASSFRTTAIDGRDGK